MDQRGITASVPQLGFWPLCVYAHGLYVLAQLLLPEETFRKLELPKDKSFLPEFAKWRRENPDPDRSLWFRYPPGMALLDAIYEAPRSEERRVGKECRY